MSIPLDKKLFHYTTQKGGLAILDDGRIMPSAPGRFLSLDMQGERDHSKSIPNVFFTELAPLNSNLFQIRYQMAVRAECYFMLTAEQLQSQGFMVFKNELSPLYSHFYNVPSPNGEGVRIDPRTCGTLADSEIYNFTLEPEEELIIRKRLGIPASFCIEG